VTTSIGAHQHPLDTGATHPQDHPHPHPVVEEARPPTRPSEAVVVDVGERSGALVLRSTAARKGLEVEIHPVADPTRRTHVWVLPRRGPDSVVYAAVFPSLVPGEYAILEPGGAPRCTIEVPANAVIHADWD
jgi:hypothetical protein